jgi:hypothetical protein
MAVSGRIGFPERDISLKLVLFALAFLGVYLAFAPLGMSLPEPGLDPSWRVVLGEAASLPPILGSTV